MPELDNDTFTIRSGRFRTTRFPGTIGGRIGPSGNIEFPTSPLDFTTGGARAAGSSVQSAGVPAQAEASLRTVRPPTEGPENEDGRGLEPDIKDVPATWENAKDIAKNLVGFYASPFAFSAAVMANTALDRNPQRVNPMATAREAYGQTFGYDLSGTAGPSQSAQGTPGGFGATGEEDISAENGPSYGGTAGPGNSTQGSPGGFGSSGEGDIGEETGPGSGETAGPDNSDQGSPGGFGASGEEDAGAESGDDGDDDSVVCTELFRMGELPRSVWLGDQRYAGTVSRFTLAGYHAWGRPLARAMRRRDGSGAVARFVGRLLARPWSIEAAHRAGYAPEGTVGGKVIRWTVYPACTAIGWLQHQIRECRRDHLPRNR